MGKKKSVPIDWKAHYDKLRLQAAEQRATTEIVFNGHSMGQTNVINALRSENVYLLDLAMKHGATYEEVHGRLTVAQWDAIREDVERNP